MDKISVEFDTIRDNLREAEVAIARTRKNLDNLVDLLAERNVAIETDE